VILRNIYLRSLPHRDENTRLESALTVRVSKVRLGATAAKAASNMSQSDGEPLKELILALDLGSSSIRCSVYEKTTPSSDKDCIVSVRQPPKDSLVYAQSTQEYSAVHPQTGLIRSPQDIIDKVDECVEECLLSLRQKQRDGADRDESSTKEGPNSNRPCKWKIVAIGFTNFSMNLVGVDKDGNVLGQDFTLCYACQCPKVSAIAEQLRR
jgi:sugar (pentulose or hexulose) kinase